MTITKHIASKYKVVALKDTRTPRDFFKEPRDQGAMEPRNGGYEAHAEDTCYCNCGCDCEKCSKKDEAKD